MFIAYFSLMSLTMMVFSACVNDTVHQGSSNLFLFKSSQFGSQGSALRAKAIREAH